MPPIINQRIAVPTPNNFPPYNTGDMFENWRNLAKWAASIMQTQQQQVGTTCTTTGRPTNVNAGFSVFDTTLGKPIWFKGSGVWVDATGTSV